MKLTATQRILVKLACDMKQEQLDDFMVLTEAPLATREKYRSSPIGYLMCLKEKYVSVLDFVANLQAIFGRKQEFSSFLGTVDKYLDQCQENDLIVIPRAVYSTRPTEQQRSSFRNAQFDMRNHIVQKHIAIMVEVSPIHKCDKENIKSFTDLWQKMEECGCICVNDVEYLKDLLAELNLAKPLKMLEEYELNHQLVQHPLNSGRRPAARPHPPVPPTVPRGERLPLATYSRSHDRHDVCMESQEGRFHAEGPIDYTRGAAERSRSYSEGASNYMHSTGSSSEGEYVTAHGSPMPGQYPNSSVYRKSASVPHSTSLSRFRDALSIPHDNIYPGGTPPTECTSRRVAPYSQPSQQQLADLNNAHPTNPEPSAPPLEVVQSSGQYDPPMSGSQVSGAYQLLTQHMVGKTRHPVCNSLSSFCGSGEFCYKPSERQNGALGIVAHNHSQIHETEEGSTPSYCAGEHFSKPRTREHTGPKEMVIGFNQPSASSQPIPPSSGRQEVQPQAMRSVTSVAGISNCSPSVSRIHRSNYPQASLDERGSEEVRQSPSLQSIAVGLGGKKSLGSTTLSESGSLIVQPSSSPPSANILLPRGTRLYPSLPPGSSSEEDELQVGKKRKTRSPENRRPRVVTGTQSKKVKLEESGGEKGSHAHVDENMTSVNAEESEDEAYSTPPEG